MDIPIATEWQLEEQYPSSHTGQGQYIMAILAALVDKDSAL